MEHQGGALTTLAGFTLGRILDVSAADKKAVVLGSFAGQAGEAIVAVEKKPFDPAGLGALLGEQAKLTPEFQNAEYGVYSMEVPPAANALKCDVIFPATAKHIAKYAAADFRLLVETPEMYAQTARGVLSGLATHRARHTDSPVFCRRCPMSRERSSATGVWR